MSYGKPQPQRFQVYTLLANQKGFTIKNCKFIFKFDRNGGWKDEYGNYYNGNGQPDEQPQDAELTPSEGSLNQGCEEDQYDNIYGPGNDFSDEEEDESHLYAKNYQKISKNLEKLQQYPARKQLRVYFSNAPYQISIKEMHTLYSKKVGGIINIIFEEENRKRNGNGYMVIENVDFAENLVKLQGQKVTQRQVYFQIAEVEEFVLDPLTPQQLAPVVPKQTSSDVPKFKPPPAEKKVEKKQEKKEEIKVEKKHQKKEEKKVEKRQYKSEIQKEDKKVENIPEKKGKSKYTAKEETVKPKEEKKKLEEKQVKKQVKKQEPKPKQKKPEFSRYILNFEIFSTKTRFVNWMEKWNYVREVDYKNIDKKQGSGKTIISMQIRNSIVQKLRGEKYQNKQVLFTLI